MMKFYKRDGRYKKMVKEINYQLKQLEICYYQEIKGDEIEAMKLEPCEKILIIGFR